MQILQDKAGPPGVRLDHALETKLVHDASLQYHHEPGAPAERQIYKSLPTASKIRVFPL